MYIQFVRNICTMLKWQQKNCLKMYKEAIVVAYVAVYRVRRCLLIDIVKTILKIYTTLLRVLNIFD